MAATTAWTSTTCRGCSLLLRNVIVLIISCPIRNMAFSITNILLPSPRPATMTLTMCRILFHYFVRNWSSLSFLKYESLRLYHPPFFKTQSEPGFFDHEYVLLSLPPLSRQRPWQRAVFACFVMITVIRRSDFLECGPASSSMNFISSSGMSLHPSPTATTTAWNRHPTSCGSNTFLASYCFIIFIDLSSSLLLVTRPPSFILSIVPFSNRNPLAGSIPFKSTSISSDVLRFRYELSTGQCPPSYGFTICNGDTMVLVVHSILD